MKNVCNLRKAVQWAIEKHNGNPEDAAILVCAVLEDQLSGMSGNGRFEDDNGDDDKEVFMAIKRFYKEGGQEEMYEAIND